MRLRVWLAGHRGEGAAPSRPIAHKDFAEMLGLSRGGLHKIVHGITMPRPELAARIEAHTGGLVTVADMMAEVLDRKEGRGGHEQA